MGLGACGGGMGEDCGEGLAMLCSKGSSLSKDRFLKVARKCERENTLPSTRHMRNLTSLDQYTF